MLQHIIVADRQVLINQLNERLHHEFSSKIAFDTKTPKVEYQLTKLAKSLLPVIGNLGK
ncbi:winged helix-turn-helix transcriptional regulator [Cytophagaceae bacterium DM2B3-1]|uniref:Winged helix-turn-helix transcriptional regulator n=1 Tax=Xanthocytophaga flava TaxID=3048013 RepID=A0ABT7D050_9BACT|nr:winged helix-turn-helix transcriptional regulator [Xanthocytophaga flavus]MDJ1466922.1 winged helix-turn-helix transcriptional regulator [Xanthocytophaga flavus]MDJ1498605.1 winged helix-turn-helix transcriptional regulator [Xanthocytophaga flavus]